MYVVPGVNEYDFFGDETSHEGKHKYMLLGGILLPRQMVSEANDKIKSFIDYRGFLHSELKFSEYKQRFLCPYTATIDYIVSLMDAGIARLFIRAHEMRLYNDKFQGRKRREELVGRCYNDFVYHRPIRLCGRGNKIDFYLDEGETTAQMPSYKASLNKKAKQNLHFKEDCVGGIEQVKSHEEPLVQAVDLFIGAYAHLLNSQDRSSHKRQFARSVVIEKLGVKHLIADLTFSHRRCLDVWFPNIGANDNIPPSRKAESE